MQYNSRNTSQPFSVLELLQEGPVVAGVLPQALEDGADVIADGELVVELAGGARVLHI